MSINLGTLVLLDGAIIKRLIDLGLLKLPDSLEYLINEPVESDDFLTYLRTESFDFSLLRNILSGFLKDVDASDLRKQIAEDGRFLCCVGKSVYLNVYRFY